MPNPFGILPLARSIMPLRLPPAYRTYAARMPVRSHFRPATCEEFECDGFMHGWVTTVDTGTELGQKQFHYITHDKTRRYTMQRTGEGVVKFVYGPGFKCFGANHKLPVDRPPILLAAGGDWRGATTPVTTHTRAEFWVEDMQGQFDGLRRIVERG